MGELRSMITALILALTSVFQTDTVHHRQLGILASSSSKPRLYPFRLCRSCHRGGAQGFTNAFRFKNPSLPFPCLFSLVEDALQPAFLQSA